jgi:curli biogenesis system outer membrane secretion channel CsgG
MYRWFKSFSLLIVFASACFAQQKNRVAVLDFDYSTVQSSTDSLFGSNVDVGKGVADLVVQNLVKSNVYSVVERKMLDKVLAEQNFSNSDRADVNTAAKLARILGVDAIIIGSVTQFGRDDKAVSIGAGGLGSRITGRLGIGGVSKRESKAVVGINARLVSTQTAEILAVAEGMGESTRSGTSLIGSGGGSAAFGGAGYDMTSTNFAESILGEATNKAVGSLSTQLDQRVARLPVNTLKVEGLVADSTDGVLVLNVGTKAGLKVGDRLEVRRVAREIKDPATGKVIRRIEEKVGEVTVTEVDEVSSVGQFAGSSPAEVGDAVASVP